MILARCVAAALTPATVWAVTGVETRENKLVGSLLAQLPAPAQLLPKASVGRVFEGTRKIRLGDVDPTGRLRFDGLTRYTQDVSNDDTTDAGMPDEPAWVVRSTVVDEVVCGVLGETLVFQTFCSSLGKRWAERRLTVVGDRGARYEVATLWVCVDLAAGQPAMLTEEFLSIYATAADGRKASARLHNPKLPVGDGSSGVVHHTWQLRKVDYDTLGHVNNAAYWAAVEQWLPSFDGPRRARVEYGKGLAPEATVDVAHIGTDDSLLLWWLEAETGPPTATASVVPLPDGLYRAA